MSARETFEHETLAAALVAAQAEMPAVEPDSVNPHFRSRFVSLGNLVAKTRPVLNRHGLAVAQFPAQDDAGRLTLVTELVHGRSGERMAYAAPLMLQKADPQGQGSAITYMRRYAWAAALGIVDQEDDDAEAAVAPPPPAEPLGDERAVALVEDIRDRYRVISETERGRAAVPRGQFEAWLDTAVRDSHERLEALQRYMAEKLADLRDGEPE